MATRVRSRTLAHLDKLLALSALATACHVSDPGYGVVDPMPIPAQDDPPSTPTIPEVTGTPPVTPPPKIPPSPDYGYGVVDPMPAPAECTTFADAIEAYARVNEGKIDVRVSLQWRYRHHAVLAATRPTIRNAVVTGMKVTSEDWTFKLVPDPSITSLSFTATGTCEGAPATAKVKLSWEKLEKGAPIEALIVDEGK